MNSANLSLLEEGAIELGVELSDDQVEKFIVYTELLKKWGSQINLTSLADDKEIVIKHFLDSLSIWSLLNTGADVLDIGSGGGFPGIPLSIVNSGLNVTLLDSVEKKVIFMKEVIRHLELNNAVAAAGRAGSIVDDTLIKGSFDFVVTRAVGGIKEVLDISLPYVKDSGKVVLMRGKDGEREWKSFIARFGKEEKHRCLTTDKIKFRLPFSGHERTVFTVSR